MYNTYMHTSAKYNPSKSKTVKESNLKKKSCDNCLSGAWTFIRICLDISSVHGLKHLVARNSLMEKLLWTILIIIALYGYIILANETWHRYQNNPTVISLEVDQDQDWNVRFAAMTICPGINDYAVRNVLRRMNISKEEQVEYKKFLMALYTPFPFKNFKYIYDFDKVHKEDYLDILLNLTYDFNPDVTATFFKTQTPRKVITEMGICYSYNSEISIYSSPEYIKKSRWDFVDTTNETVRVTSNMGTLSTTVSNFEHQYYTYFHSYNDVIDIVTPRRHTQARGISQISLYLTILWTTPGVEKLSPLQRGCRFPYESNLEHSPVYSYTLCRIECRIQLCLHYCGCLPYFYRRLDGEKICDPSGMRCLSNYTDIFETLNDIKKNKSLCECVANCDEDRAVVESFQSGEWLFGSSLEWKISQFPKMRFRRELIFGITDVLIYVGGMAGLFLGCGILSFVEIVYFFTLKLFWFIMDSKKSRKTNQFK